jgi:hypothetical protein
MADEQGRHERRQRQRGQREQQEHARRRISAAPQPNEERAATRRRFELSCQKCAEAFIKIQACMRKSHDPNRATHFLLTLKPLTRAYR